MASRQDSRRNGFAGSLENFSTRQSQMEFKYKGFSSGCFDNLIYNKLSFISSLYLNEKPCEVFISFQMILGK